MTDQPPSPLSPSSGPTVASPSTDAESADRVQLTTPQLTATLESVFDTTVDESTLETFLFELDRRGYVEWVTLTRHGAYVWDVSETPDAVGDAVATAVISGLESWLEGSSSTT